MGTGKKEAVRKERQGESGLRNVKVKGENFFRTAKKVRTLNMLKGGAAQRNSQGRITKAASYQSREISHKALVEPNRKWFSNSRVISQDALHQFREAIEARTSDPYQVLLKTNKLPLSLVHEPVGKNGLKQHQAKVAVESASFSHTFGPKAVRKRVTMAVGSLEGLAEETSKMHDTYQSKTEDKLANGTSIVEQAGEGIPEDETMATAKEPIFSKGQSKRIWNELYKVIDSSDVVIHVLDARDPVGTRCRSVERYLQREAPHKHLVFVLNKCDLVPTSVAASWVRYLSKEVPTLAFHASITNSFGKGSLIQLLRQFSSLHSARKQISVGFIGYPNTGKSSIINTLRKKKVCVVASIPGETKCWQYITLMKRIYLIDCPGIVPPNTNDTEEDILLRGVVRVENVDNPDQYISAILNKVKTKHIERTYAVKGYTNSTEFLEMLARKGGRLLKGGEADLDGVAKMVINDFLRGKLPWFTDLPSVEGKEGPSETLDRKQVESGVGLEGRNGALGEMRNKKRKRDAAEEDAVEGVEEANDEDDVRAGRDLEEDDGSSDEYDEGEEGSDPEKENE